MAEDRRRRREEFEKRKLEQQEEQKRKAEAEAAAIAAATAKREEKKRQQEELRRKHLEELCARKDLESCQTYHTFLLIHDVVPDPKRRKSALPDEEGWHPPMMKAPGDV